MNANLGLTLALGVLVAIPPTVVLAGPVFSKYAARWVDVKVPDLFVTGEDRGEEEKKQRPSFAATLAAILLPVVLMLGKAFADVIAPDSEALPQVRPRLPRNTRCGFGSRGSGRYGAAGSRRRNGPQGHLEVTREFPTSHRRHLVDRRRGGGFKQVLIDTGIAGVIADAIKGSSLPPVLFLAWLVAVLIRVATGSATVATVTASGILAPVAADLSSAHVSLMVLAIGAGSLFLSHVNDAGFWLVKEYLASAWYRTSRPGP